MRALNLINKPQPEGRKLAGIWLMMGDLAGGLAWASKLNGSTMIEVNIVIAFVLGIRLNNSLKEKVIHSIWYVLVTGIASLFIFLVVNPFLWEAPVERILRMFENRTEEIDQQIVDYPGSYMDLGSAYGSSRRASFRIMLPYRARLS